MREGSPLKILFVSGIFPPDAGGPASYIANLAPELVARGHDVTVLTLSDAPHARLPAYPFKTVRIARLMNKPVRWLLTVWAIVRLGRPADVLYVNGLAMESVLANLMLRKPLVHKVVGDLAWERLTNQGLVSDSFEEFQARRHSPRIEMLKMLRAWWTRQAKRVIVPSHYLERAVGAWGVAAERITVIYNAVEDHSGTEIEQVPLKTSFNVATVGRLVSLKRVDGILRALRSLEDVGLIVVGDGPEEASLRQLAVSSAISERVYFAGRRTQAEVRALMARSDVIVLNSTHEGLPHVLLEAMSLGLPVVATRVGGTPEVVRDGQTGRLIPPGSDTALVAALTEFAASADQRRQFGEAGRALAQQLANYDAMIGATERVLQAAAFER